MDPLSALLNLKVSEKEERGLQHTPAEIAQQPETWVATFEGLQRRKDDFRRFLSEAGVNHPSRDYRPTVFLVGAGTSDYIGRSLHHLLRTQWQCEVVPVASTSLLTDFSEYVLPERRYLWLSFSRSGDSPEGLAVLHRALDDCPNVSHVLVSCNANGRMNRTVKDRANCFPIVLDKATNDRGLAMTSSFTNMVLAGQVLAHARDLNGYEPILDVLVDAARDFMPRAASLASELVSDNYRKACFVGTGVLAGTALECALKLLELTAGRVSTMSQATLALRHGPMAALDRDTLFVSLVSSQPQRRSYEVDLLREIGNKKLVRTRVAVASESDSVSGDAEHVLAPHRRHAIPDLYRPVLDVIFGQLLGLFASIHCGLAPDRPSPNGAISRVVQNVGIY